MCTSPQVNVMLDFDFRMYSDIQNEKFLPSWELSHYETDALSNRPHRIFEDVFLKINVMSVLYT